MSNSEQISSFNLRVYGLLFHEGQVLVTDEVRGGMSMTKFPGGGLEMGEGLADCLIREFQEELNLMIEVSELFYTNDFLQVSAFDKTDQLQSFYFIVKSEDEFDLEKWNSLHPTQRFRWIDFSMINPSEFTFPIDRVVAEKLQNHISR